MRASIFVTDDDEVIRAAMTRHLARNQHYVRGFDSGETLLQGLDEDTPDLILLDLKMGGMTGIETLKQVRSKVPQALVILLTAYGTVQDAVESMRLGAYDFVIKSVDLSGVDPVVNRALEYLKLRNRVESENQDINSRYAFNNLIANSASMRDLLAKIQDLAQNPKTTVLLQGETGTGKEFVARVLHYNSPRSHAPFVGVNCTAVPKELFESEFFGHERGAFTGAVQRKMGLCEQAEGGTLFLDEIGDLDLSMQAKLLRVLQERTIKRLGGKLEVGVDFRLIAATNRDLRQEVAKGTFREDLFFRLNVVALELPPLRQRVEDIMPLALQALVKHAKNVGKEIQSFDPQAKILLERYSYPGNIRELENIIERAIIFCQGKTLTPGDFPRELLEQAKAPVSAVTRGDEQVVQIEMILGKQTLADIESALIEEVMRLSGSNKSQAAKQLGLTRFALDRRLKKTMEDI
jgi:two-component system response regulator AtoC